ncbi:MAG: tRNA (guanosine(37)-N1)-methyltransferase TrmD [Alphaproteobacteria bacterium]|nr:tRNA (guanosine(37)-N1)-methyltransferase TrmD [Alphaproteobacteria bacterium]
MSLSFTIITLFPDMYPGPLGCSLLGKALASGLWRLQTLDLRTYGLGRYGSVDDTCYGGGAGMVIRADVVDAALRDAIVDLNHPTMIYMTPRGRTMAQSDFQTQVQCTKDVVILCGRYEGVDQRVLDFWNFQELSLGDFVLCGGDIPAMAFIEGCVRLLPGVLHNPDSCVTESFQSPLLEHPLYTRPALWNGVAVPQVLMSGHHGQIQAWQHAQSTEHTKKVRPDLWKQYTSQPTE